MDSNHCQIVERSITGERAVDEQTFASLTTLTERLQHLRKLDKMFTNVKFSPAVEKLTKWKNPVAVS